MMRVRRQWQAEAIFFGISLLPEEIQDICDPETGMVHFFTGDPIYSGLHDFRTAHDGRSLRETAHVCYVHHQQGLSPDKRVTTVVLPENNLYGYEPQVIVHEIGHVVHAVLDFEEFDLPYVSDYAKETELERFAEAFTAYCLPNGLGYEEEASNWTARTETCSKS